MSAQGKIDPLLAERRRLGEVEAFTLRATSLVEAHRALGARLSGPASASIHARLATTSPAHLEDQIRTARSSRSFLETQATARNIAGDVRSAIGEYLACLDGWARGVRAEAWIPHPLVIDGERVSAEDLALWAQDDNVGCQTGARRQADGSILFWHTEEDRLAYLDRPRVASFAVGGETLSAFVYPYLLPGPAFGFRADQIHAVDSLVLHRGLAPKGAFTSAASFLIWRLGSAVAAREVLRALSPYLDGCAINVARIAGGGVEMETHEIGGHHVQSRALGATPGALCAQANAVLDADTPLARHERLSPVERARYDQRVARALDALGSRAGAPAKEPGREDILRLLASRRGGRHAFANLTVKGHFVARVSASGFEIHIGTGAALPTDPVTTMERSPHLADAALVAAAGRMPNPTRSPQPSRETDRQQCHPA